MKILFCSQSEITANKGGAKVVYELAAAMRDQGWECDLRGPEHLVPGWDQLPSDARRPALHKGLREYLLAHAGEYDVVDYPFEFLAHPRSDFAAHPLFVARSVLLTLHFEKIPLPPLPRLRSRIGGMLLKKKRQRQFAAEAALSVKTLLEADMANVSCQEDKDEIVSRGVPAEKVLVLPYGIGAERRHLFDAISPADVPTEPLIAFVGTVDARKGINDLPRIFTAIARQVPAARFYMLGAGYRSEEEVRHFFPPELQSRMIVQPRYEPQELPSLLAKCSAGVFPSHVEGFPFGVLEMLAAALPVIAYKAPGPTSMLTSEYLVPRGDWQAMADKACVLLNDQAKLAAARHWSQQRSRDFEWPRIASETIAAYTERMEARKKAASA